MGCWQVFELVGDKHIELALQSAQERADAIRAPVYLVTADGRVRGVVTPKETR
jgi:hypothetical protein